MIPLSDGPHLPPSRASDPSRPAVTEPSTNYETFMRLLIEEESAVKVYVRRLVPTWHDVEGGGIWTVRADGSELERITTTPDAFHHPVWSADGQSVFAVTREAPMTGGRILTDQSPWDRPVGWRLIRTFC